MEKERIRLIKWVFLIFSFLALIIFSICFYYSFALSRSRILSQNESKASESSLYHIIITGTYENQSFLTQMYDGASRVADSYNAVVELIVPKSQADTTSIQNLFNYASFLNADGLIAYIDSSDDNPVLLQRSGTPPIPLITTGQFSPSIQQISFIGTNNWELGKKIADEIQNLMPYGGNVHLISDSSTINSNNLISSLQLALQEKYGMLFSVGEKLSYSYKMPSEKKNIFVCLTEDDTIRTAQLLSELFDTKDYMLLGFGGNEVCQLYLQKGFITELFSLDPESIGEAAIKELFEYRTKGYTNSYVTADVKITRGQR